MKPDVLSSDRKAELFLLSEIHNRLAVIAERGGGGKQPRIEIIFEVDGSIRIARG